MLIVPYCYTNNECIAVTIFRANYIGDMQIVHNVVYWLLYNCMSCFQVEFLESCHRISRDWFSETC